MTTDTKWLAKKIKEFIWDDIDKLVIISDFDWTLTHSKRIWWWSNSLISILRDQSFLNTNYKALSENLFQKYHRFENSCMPKNKRKLETWLHKHIELLYKYWLNKSTIKNIEFKNNILVRDWFFDFFNILKNKKIPITIISWWLTFLIKDFLQYHKIDTKNMTIFSNEVKFKNKSLRIKKPIITSINKSKLKISKKLEKIHIDSKILLLWDNPEDAKIIRRYEGVLKIWLWVNPCLNWNFDFTLEEASSLQDIIKWINLSQKSI